MWHAILVLGFVTLDLGYVFFLWNVLQHIIEPSRYQFYDMQNDDDTIITCGIQNYLIENLIRYSIFSRIVSKIGGGITREYNYFEER